MLQLLQDVTFSKDILEKSFLNKNWKDLNKKIGIYLSMESDIIQNSQLSFKLISSIVWHYYRCKEMSCSCNKSNTCHIFSSNQLAVNVEHFHEYLEFLIQAHIKQDNFYQISNIYIFIQYLSYLIHRNKFTDVAGKTTQLIREKIRGKLQMGFFLDVQVEALLKISKNLMTGNFQSKIIEQKQSTAFLQAEKFLKAESTLKNLIGEVGALIMLKIKLYEQMKQGFDSYYHLIKQAQHYLEKINQMEQQLIQFHDFASYSVSKNLLVYFYLNIQGDFRKAKSSQKLRCVNNAERPIMNEVLMAFSNQVVTITASVGKDYGSILKYSQYAPQFFGYNESNFFQVKRIEQLMPNFISCKHELLVDHFIQTGESSVVREKRMVLIKKNLDVLSAAQLFLCFNFCYLDDFVFTAFFCEPEIKDYNPKKEIILVFDQQMKLAGHNESLLLRLGMQKISKRHLSKIELQEIFPEIDIVEIIDSEAIEYQNAKFQFPLFNNQQGSVTSKSQIGTQSNRSFKTIQSGNTTLFKQQDWCLYICDIKLVNFYRKFRSGEVLQYFVCTLKDLREEALNSDADSTVETDFSEFEQNNEEIKQSADQQHSSSHSSDLLEEKENDKDQKENSKLEQAKQIPVNKQRRESCKVVYKFGQTEKKNLDDNENGILQQSNTSQEQQLNKQVSDILKFQQMLAEKEAAQTLQKKKQKNEKNKQIRQNVLQRTSIDEQIIKSKNNKREENKELAEKKEKLEEIQENQRKEQAEQAEKNKKKKKHETQEFNKFKTISKKQSLLSIDKSEFLLKQRINIKKPEERIRQNHINNKMQSVEEVDEIETFQQPIKYIQKQISQQLRSRDLDQKNQIQNSLFKFKTQRSAQGDIFQQNSPLVSNRTAITTIESEIGVNRDKIYQTNEKRKIEQENTQKLAEVGVENLNQSEIPEIKEVKEENLKENSSKDNSLNIKTDARDSQSSEQTNFQSMQKLRRSVFKITEQIKEKNKSKKKQKFFDNFFEMQSLNDDQKGDMIQQIIAALLKKNDTRASVMEKQLLEMEPQQLFQKYNQIYYDNYAKTKKGKENLSHVFSGESQSHQIIIQKSEGNSKQFDERYDFKKYEDNMSIIDKYIKIDSINFKLSFIKLIKIIEFALIIIGITVSSSIQKSCQNNFYQQINIVKSQTSYLDSLNEFTALTILVDTQSDQFASSALSYFSQLYLLQMQQYMDLGYIVQLYENSQIPYYQPQLSDESSSQLSISYRNAFFLNFQYLQNKEQRSHFYVDIFQQYTENIVQLVNDKLDSLSSDLSSFQQQIIVLFSCVQVCVVVIFFVGVWVFYSYQKNQRQLQKLICNVPLKQIDIERVHLLRVKKSLEQNNQNEFQSFKLLSFRDEIYKRLEEFDQQQRQITSFSQSYNLDIKNKQKRCNKTSNFIAIKSKKHTEVSLFVSILMVCLICQIIPSIFMLYTNLIFIGDLPDSKFFYQKLSNIQNSLTCLNTLNILYQIDYSQNLNKYFNLFQQSLNYISQYESILFQDKTLYQGLFTASQIEALKDQILNENICANLPQNITGFNQQEGQLTQRCSNIFDGILLQGSKLTFSFLYNRYSIFSYQQSNYLQENKNNELTFYVYYHAQAILATIEGYFQTYFDSNQTRLILLLTISLIALAIVYLAVILVYFEQLKRYSQITKQLIYLIPFSTIQIEESLIKTIKRYSQQNRLNS
ncbi:transmembrane protein, putative (macronuclear) [Tetrahymena thermophila SB210]|uniref:Transmembrane protein, putative n=1 Tax=Tetrahymena thermophila (strain SB210) TaxID=312017 RepID=I7M9Z4_TETTS|nr:transmembrane protein, putative [Tetrahymena thermophila SB210]EAS03099.2 transmembrane protein, putative [Tetrahymena thermophila SB210]|eukprot:XP_001023344.2 transmembrane protein, putative [Tetrahymena thermophila SB210]